jgi:hypothetical protein
LIENSRQQTIIEAQRVEPKVDADKFKVVVIKGPHFEQALQNAYATAAKIIRQKIRENQAKKEAK